MSRPANGKRPPEAIPTPSQPFVFDWYENRVEEGLRELWKRDSASRNAIVRVVEEMQDSDLFNHLVSCYTDAHAECKGDTGAEAEVLKAFLARVYIAGSLREYPMIDK